MKKNAKAEHYQGSHIKTSISYRIFTICNAMIMLTVIVLTLYPFATLIAKSFSSEAAIMSGQVSIWPKGFNVLTYKFLMRDRVFWINYRNTLIYTVVGTFISMVITTIVAYVLSKKNLLWRNAILFFVVFTMFVQGGLIPNYVLVTSLGLRNTIWAVTLPSALSVFNMLIMKTFFEGLPVELEEAAEIDGYGKIGIMLKVCLPLSKAIIATMTLFYAVSNWNSWFNAFLYLDNRLEQPVSIYLRNLIAGLTGANDVASGADAGARIAANLQSVAIVLTMLPIMCVYPFVQKHFVKGVMLGSIKS